MIAKFSLSLRNFLYHCEIFAIIAKFSLCYREIANLLLHPPGIFQLAISSFSSLLSSWSLIYEVEFDLNSSCLDRLNNFGMISSQKLQKFPQNVINRIIGTLMCKSG